MTEAPHSVPFRVDHFLSQMRGRNLRWGLPFHFSEHTGSTNDDALQASRNGAASGSLFATEHQSCGRGRQGKRWLSKAGQGLLFSLLLKPEPGSTANQTLTLAAGLAVRAALARHLPPTQAACLKIKWPNDIVAQQPTYANGSAIGSKLAGLLCEGQLSGKELQAMVIGVGLNVQPIEASEDLGQDATSLVQLGAPTSMSRETLLIDILEQMQKRIVLDEALPSPALLEEYRLHDALHGKSISVLGAASGELLGVARGIDDQGRLLLETAQGIVPIFSGTVRLS